MPKITKMPKIAKAAKVAETAKFAKFMKAVVKSLKSRRGMVLFCAALLAAGPITAPAPAAQNRILSSEGPAAGRREHMARVSRWGRYLVEVKSAEGVALEVADKLRGPFASDGAAGESDGRIEVFLEAGEYKVVTEGPRDARGSFALAVTEFSPDGQQGGAGRDYEYLNPYEQAAAELGEHGARAWWIFVPQDTMVYIEAAGRHLGSLAVFRGGDWLVAEASARDGGRTFVSAAAPRKPLNGLRFAKRLERGKHLVVAYGGGRDRYTESDGASPLFVQWMAEPIGSAQQISAKINASGVNRYAISAKADISAMVIESSEKLFVQQHSIGAAAESDGYGRINAVSQDSLRPAKPAGFALQVRPSPRQMLSVSGKPGAAFKITPVSSPSRHVREFSLRESGEYQLITLHTGIAADNIGASGVLVAGRDRDASIVALKADTVSSSRILHRKFNLLDEVTSYVWVDQAGTYTFAPGGTEYEWRVARFLLERPRNYTEPKTMRQRGDVTLDRGLYVIELEPVNRGVASFTLSHKSADRKAVAETKAARPNPSVVLERLNLSKGVSYRFYLNSQSPEQSLIHVDKYPMSVREDRIARITGADAEREEQSTAKMAELKPGAPQYAVVGQKGFRTYVFTIPSAGIYKVETTGRLRAKLTVRNRVNHVHSTASANGPGRNALVAEYFLPGSYVLVAEAQGESAGQMGVVLSKGDLRSGGRMADGVDRREPLKAYGAAVYDFAAGADGRYRIESFGQFSAGRVRFEDPSGWPMFRHGAVAPEEVVLKKGASYKLYALPAGYDNYRVSRVQHIARPQEIAGKGPHNIRVNEPLNARWTDTDGGANEIGSPARFLLDMPAPADVRITLSPDFHGAVKPQGKDTVLIKIDGPYRGALQAGKYEIAVTPLKKRNHTPYELSIATTDLIAGTSYKVDTMRTLRVRVGEAGVYEIFSQGRAEVAARLFERDMATEAARGGGHHQDWNFTIKENLQPGTYFLRLISDDKEELPFTRVFMRQGKADSASAVQAKAQEDDAPIKAESGKELALKIGRGRERVFDIGAPAKNFRTAALAMSQGQPMVGLSASSQNADFARGKFFARGGQHIDENMCLTAAIPGDTGRIIGWNALHGGPADGVFANFLMTDYELENAEDLKTGRTVWRAGESSSNKTPSAKEYRVKPNGNIAAVIKLSPQTGVLHISADGKRNLYYGGESGAMHALDLNGGRLFLFGGTDGAAPGHIELLAYAPQSASSNNSANNTRGQTSILSAATPVTKEFTVDTREMVRVDARAASGGRSRLFWSGAVESVAWINRSGQIKPNVKSGTAFSSPNASGFLLVNYAPGWSSLKLCADGGSRDLFAQNQCLWGETAKPENVTAINEMTRLTMADGVNWYAVDLPEPSHVSLSAAVPAAAVILNDGGKAVSYKEFWDALSLDVPLAAGKYTVGVKPITGRTLSGAPLTAGFFPIDALSEDKPLDMYLMSGQKRIVRFDLQKKSRIGIGLSASAAAVEAILMDETGKEVSHGRQIFAELDKGTYYMLLFIPQTSSAQTAFSGTGAKLYLFGQNNPPADPPEGLVRWIIGGGVGERP